jgi:hypothetical protein
MIFKRYASQSHEEQFQIKREIIKMEKSAKHQNIDIIIKTLENEINEIKLRNITKAKQVIKYKSNIMKTKEKKYY